MTGSGEGKRRDESGPSSQQLELDLNQVVGAIFAAFPSVQVTVLPKQDAVEVARDRPLTPGRVHKVLERLRNDLPTEGLEGDVVVVANDYHLQIMEHPKSGERLMEVDLLPVRSIDPVPHAAVANALRMRELRAKLLESGAYDYEAIAEARQCTVDAARQFVSRARKKNRLITVRHDERTHVPQFLLDDVLDPIDAFRPIIKKLVDAGERGWAAWTWLVSPSAWLDGGVPADLVLGGQSDVVYTALDRRLSNAA